MRSAGVAPVDDSVVRADGELIRFDIEGDRHGTRNGWLVLHSSPAFAVFGSWKTGARGTWSRHDDISPADRARIGADIDRAKAARRDQKLREQHAAQIRAQRMWDEAAVADPAHAYLVAKAISTHGVRQAGDLLLVPMRESDGRLWAIQTITPAGDKRFLRGSRKRGLYCAIGGCVGETLLVAEGFATAASVHEATGYPAACAFDAGNLEPVAIALRAKYPTARIVICADDDRATADRIGVNPGIEAATRAARAVHGAIALPEFDA
ncbi:MAG: toprim domain-containing protein [Dokdonella sp.]